ncbi:MAG: LCP family protein [Candidatus Saccharimonadales bacterium]
MDRSKLKRPVTKIQRQTTQKPFGNTLSVPKVVEGRPIDLGYSARSQPSFRRQSIYGSQVPPSKVIQQRIQPDPINEATPIQQPTQVEQTQIEEPTVTKLAQHIPMDMTLPGEESLFHNAIKLKQTRWQRTRLVAVKGIAVLLVIIISFGGLFFSQAYMKLNKVFKGSNTVAALRSDVSPSLLKGEGSGRVNILLMGRGGGNHDGPDLTDSMMVASIDPVNYKATLISIPRDLWVNVPNAGVMKINSAWEKGEFNYLGKVAPGSTDPKAISSGFNLADQTVDQVLGINIDYNVLVDFQAFQQAVDNVGGITVNVPTPLIDPTFDWVNNGNPVLAQAGIQNFNGTQALNYVRSRETTSDFARADRQRAVLVALKTKIESLGTLSNPLKIDNLINTFGNNVATDLSLSNVSRLYSIEKKISAGNVSSVGLDAAPNQYVTTGNMAGQSIVLPKAGLFNYNDIQQYVRGLLKDPYLIKENAKVEVLNGTLTPGLATNVSNQLKSYGYNVIFTGNTPNSGWTQTTVVNLTHGKDKYTQHYLELRYGVQAVNSLSDNSIPTNGADFVIIIGSDEANITQNKTY